MKRMVVTVLALAGVAACGWPQTRMVEVGSEQATAAHQVVTAAPSYTAGPSYVRTTALDGASTAFVCSDGGVVAAWHVPADSTLVC